MYTQLVETAKQFGHGDLLVGLYYIQLNWHVFTDQLLADFDAFMAEGRRMFEPVDTAAE
mgnify:CR=1 FL=1